MIYARPGKSFIAESNGPATGLVGTFQVGIFLVPADTVVTAYTTAGITESPAGSGNYVAVLTAPAAAAADGTEYVVRWKNGAATEQEGLIVTGGSVPTPLDPPDAALDRLKRLIANDQEPILSDDELADILSGAKRTDPTGLLPSEDGWTPTYDLNAAAADGWLTKAGKVSPNYSFGIDAARDEQSDVFKHCMAMHEKFASGRSGSAKAQSMVDDFDVSLTDVFDPWA